MTTTPPPETTTARQAELDAIRQGDAGLDR